MGIKSFWLQANAKYPDFKHKQTEKALWLNGSWNPPWVEAELAAMSPGSVQLNIFAWNARLARYNKSGQYEETMELYHQMKRDCIIPDRITFVRVLSACANLRALKEGRYIHAEIVQSGCESDVYVGSSLVDMYAKCGSIEDAWRVFNIMPTHDVVAWSAMILGHVKCGQGQKALELFDQMQQDGVEPDSVTFIGVVNACASVGALDEGKRVHEQIVQSGCDADIYLCNSLVDMYAKCGSIEGASKVFNSIPTRDVVAWNAMISGYVKCGQGLKALELFQQMQQERIELDTVTFVGVLNACASIGALEEGRLIHKQIIQSGCESHLFVGSSLVDMYAKCGSIEDASRAFYRMPTRDVVSWNAMIMGYVKCDQWQRALELYQQMQREGVVPDSVTFVGVLNACASVVALDEGRRIHAQIIQSGCELDVFVGNSLVDMYAKCGSIEDAWKVFNRMPTRDVVVWNAMILGCVKCGQGQKALELFQQMLCQGVEPDAIAFVGALNACANVGALGDGRHVHEQIIESGFEDNVFVGCSLIDMYAKCGSIEDAWSVFNSMPLRDIVAWSAMILGHAKCGQGQKALELFEQMQQEGVEPDYVTFMGVLNACASLGALEHGRRVHRQIIRSNCESHVYVGNSLVDMYVKCGSMEDAWRLFNKMPIRTVVAWSALILGHVKCGQGEKALELFRQMQLEGVEPDPVTFVGVLNACASVAALEEGRRVEEQIIQSCCEYDVFVGNSLVNMYSKCGSIDDAFRVFNELPSRDIVSWNAMLGGYAMHGHAKEAIAHVQQMCEDGLEIDNVTFVSLLSACSHAGLVDEGLHYLESMSIVYSIPAKLEHYSCIVDLLGRAGHLDDAEDLIKMMPCEPSGSVWKALLGACRIHGNVEMGECIAKKVLELDPGNSASYVPLANIYAAAGK